MAFVRDLSGNGRTVEPDVAQPRTTESAADSNAHTPSDLNWVKDSAGNRRVARGFLATTGGTVTYETPSGLEAVVEAPANVLIPVKLVRIKSTGTTASDFTVFF